MNHPRNREIALRFQELSFAYGPVKVLERASFHIHQGEFIALVGPNGSGKTTVLKLLLGLEKPQEGRIEITGPAHRGIGYVPQQAPLDRAFPIPVREVVRMGLLQPWSRRFTAEDRAAVEEALEQTGLQSLAERSYAGLSGGQRRRVMTARALAAKPAILILDEPAANMDAESETRLFETLGRLKGRATILIVTHDMGYVSSLTDRVLCMGDREGEGRIVEHPTEASGETESFRVIHGKPLAADICTGAADTCTGAG